jgi:hypothetical protein
MKSTVISHVYPAAEEFPKFSNQGHVLKQAGSGIESHQQVDVALLIRFSAGHRAEDADVPSAATSRDFENFFPFFFQLIAQVHVINSSSRIEEKPSLRPTAGPRFREVQYAWLRSA